MKKIILILTLSIVLVSCGTFSKETVESSDSTKTSELSSSQSETHSKEMEEPMKQFESGTLIQAVTQNDSERVQEIMMDKTYNINEVNDRNETPLLIATHNNYVEIAKILIDNGADVNQQDNIQDSPYLYAGAQGKTEILSYMIENSKPNQQIYNRFGGNTIIPAAEKGHLDTVKVLLEDGTVDIDHQNNYGYTALIEAVALTDGSQVYQDIVAELLKYGADRTLKDNYGKTATDYARELGYGNILKMLENQ
ncbi:ankyrin repeat domain-containing protein [Vagococcus fluvialis]|uniref:ankyrin repeat domain-containing protein n=1 Tax=Vagococcus fluvialis TaxID=2738 RepID=UPI003B5A0373